MGQRRRRGLVTARDESSVDIPQNTIARHTKKKRKHTKKKRRHTGEQEALPRSRDVFAKEWDLLFSGPRNINDDQFFVDRRRELFLADQTLNDDNLQEESRLRANADKNGIKILLRDFDDSVALIQVNHVEKFCEDVSLEALASGLEAVAGNRKAAWVDDRQMPHPGTGKLVREHHNPLTATSFYRLLKRPVRTTLKFSGHLILTRYTSVSTTNISQMLKNASCEDCLVLIIVNLLTFVA
jgi:hypothetical protein